MPKTVNPYPTQAQEVEVPKLHRRAAKQGRGREIIMNRLMKGPARWVEFQRDAFKVGLSKYVVTNALSRMREEGKIERTLEGWVLVDESSIQSSDRSNRTAVE
jgi:hypothetical protein